MAFTNKKINKDGLLTVKVLPEELKKIEVPFTDEDGVEKKYVLKIATVKGATSGEDEKILVFQEKKTESK